jgi:signal transduction histidine kinase
MQSTRERLSIRAAVFLGFGFIFGLWMFAWVQLSLRIGAAQRRAEAINTRYVSAQETLSNIRSNVLMASVAFRDALLDPDPGNMSRYRSQLEGSYTTLDALLRAYKHVSDAPTPEEREQFARLESEVDAYRRNMLDVLASDRKQWLVEARNVLSRRVTPRRDIIIAVSEGVQSLNRAGYVEQQSEIGNVYQSVQRDLWQVLGLALAVGIAVAILAIVYAGRLERRLRQQLAKDVELAHDLQELSAKLVSIQEQERRHIARELHDEIGQALTAIKMELAYAQRSIERAQGATTVLQAARAITDDALHQVRDLSYLLHPAALDEFGLVSAVDEHVKSFGKRNGIAAELSHASMNSRLAQETETAAYRIIQEALNNVAKHAKATQCKVCLARQSDILRIVVEDNGVGFAQSAPRSHDRRGLGLIGIRERASHLNGTVVMESVRGRGTRIVVELPVRRATDAGCDTYAPDTAPLAG